MKIIFAQLAHEANNFSVERTDAHRWMPSGWLAEEEILSACRDVTDFAGGFIRAGERLGVELIPSVAAWNAGPLLKRETWDNALNILLSAIKRHKNKIDGICLGLHGAGAAEGIDDLETATLKAVREIVGAEMPIGVCLDLHGNLSEEMMPLADFFIGCKQYPHIDVPETAEFCMELLLDLLEGNPRFQTALCRIPLLIPPATACTFEQPMKDIAEHFKLYAGENGLLDASLFHGFPYLDVPSTGASVTVTAHEDAQQHAQTLARYVWERRQQFIAVIRSPEAAFDQALKALDGPGKGFVVIHESADNPGAGASGDGTFLLREMLRRDRPRSIFGFIRDSETALSAHKAGVGARISGMLGNKVDTTFTGPVPFRDAEILALSNGDVRLVTPIFVNLPTAFGKAARLRIGNTEVVVTEYVPNQTFDDRPFLTVGADVTQYEIVCLKSSNHFKAFYTDKTRAMISADPPGISTSDLTRLPYRKIKRPIFPLDNGAVFP